MKQYMECLAKQLQEINQAVSITLLNIDTVNFCNLIANLF